MDASNSHFARKKKTSPRESQKPWWTKECHIATKNARKAFKTWRSTLQQEDKTYLNKMEAIKKRTILAEKNRSWERHIETLDDGNAAKFWKFSKTMMNGRRETTNTPLNNCNGEPIIDPLEKANIFLDQFSPLSNDTTALNPEQEKEIETSQEKSECDPLDMEFSLQELSRSLQHLPDKAMGLDRIYNRMLKNLNANNRVSLLSILNLMFKEGYVPKDWKCAIVTPILKPNKHPGAAESYRPISLTSCLGKTFEKMINNRLKWHLDNLNILPKAQTGFRRGCTTTDNLIRIEASIKSGFNTNCPTTAIFLDIAKAYDNAWIEGILLKLTRANIRGRTLIWLRNFLTGRSIRTRVNHQLSEERATTKGVPQGSVLSPLLFNVMLSDFPTPHNGCELSLFADDIAIYYTAKTKQDTIIPLQNLLDEINDWAKKWKFQFSVDKCASLTFTRKRNKDPEHNFKLSAATISEVLQYKFLGIILDQKLSWEPHTKTTINKIQRRSNLIRTLTYGRNTLKIAQLIRIHKAMIRSAYDYGSIILNSIPKARLDKLEQAQNQILRIILGGFKSTPRVLLNIETGIYPVKDRWDQLAYNYIIRLNEKPWNPAYDTIQKLMNKTWKINSVPAAIAHLRKLDPPGKKFFRNTSSHTPEVEPLPPWKHFYIPTTLFPLTKRQALNATQVPEIFKALTANQDPNHIEIYTDGSVCESTKTSSCAFFVPKHKEEKAWLLQNFTNSFNAELYAIRQALYYLNNWDNDSVTIFTDSKSAVQAISNFKWDSSPAIPEIIKQIANLNSSGTRITLSWIPSHTGIPGNETADYLATNIRKNQRNTTGNTIKNKIDVKQNIATVKANHKQMTFTKLKSKSTNMAVTNRQDFGFLPWHNNKNRNIQTVMFRLRSGHNKLNHFISKLEPETLDECPHGCPEKEDASHVLLYCQHYEEVRANLEQQLPTLNFPLNVPTLLGLNSSKHTRRKITSCLISYLLETELIKRKHVTN